MAVGGGTGRYQVRGLQVDVVEQVGDKAVGNGGGWTNVRCSFIAFFIERRRDYGRDERGRGLLDGESRHDLRLAFVEKLKIVLLEGADRAALAVSDDDGNKHQVHTAAEGNRRLAGANLGDWCGGRRRDRGLRITERSTQPNT
jgi:hypothetical protein